MLQTAQIALPLFKIDNPLKGVTVEPIDLAYFNSSLKYTPINRPVGNIRTPFSSR